MTIIYKTQHWEFAPNKQELLYPDNTIKQLPARLSHCLEALLNAQGQTIPYDELLQSVWGTLHKDSNTIASVISELRKSICIDADGVKYIITVPKKGYRFNQYEEVELKTASEDSRQLMNQRSTDNLVEHNSAMLENEMEQRVALDESVLDKKILAQEILDEKTFDDSQFKENDIAQSQSQSQSQSESQSSNQVITSPQKNISSKFKYSNLKYYVLFLLIFSLFIFLFIDRLYNNSFTLQNANVINFGRYDNPYIHTHEQGRELYFDVTQDKQWLVYVMENTISKNLILRNLKTGVQSELMANKNEKYTSAAFSRDGTAVIYLHQTDSKCSIYQTRINPEGFIKNEQRKITDCGQPDGWMTLSYSADGESIFFSKSSALSQPYLIIKHDLKTGYERSITSPPSSGRGDYSFSLSPDGNTIAFIRNVLWEKSSIWLLNLKSGETKLAFTLPDLINSISWESNNNIVYVSSNKIFRYQLALDKVEEVYASEKPLSFPLHRDNSLFVTRGHFFKSNIWQLDTKKMTINPPIASDDIDKYPTRTQNNKFYFISNRSGASCIWQNINGSEKNILSNDDIATYSNLTRLDDNYLLALSLGRIIKINLNNGEAKWLTSEEKVINSFSISDDNKKLVYANELNEVWFLELLDISTGQLELLGVQGFTAKYSKENILITNFREPGLWKYNRNTRERSLYVDNFEVYDAQKWAVVDDHIMVINKNKILIYNHDGNKAVLYKEIVVDGDPRSISCNNELSSCRFDLYQLGNTEIIELAQVLNK